MIVSYGTQNNKGMDAVRVFFIFLFVKELVSFFQLTVVGKIENTKGTSFLRGGTHFGHLWMRQFGIS